jgi:hypothetical protein
MINCVSNVSLFDVFPFYEDGPSVMMVYFLNMYIINCLSPVFYRSDNNKDVFLRYRYIYFYKSSFSNITYVIRSSNFLPSISDTQIYSIITNNFKFSGLLTAFIQLPSSNSLSALSSASSDSGLVFPIIISIIGSVILIILITIIIFRYKKKCSSNNNDSFPSEGCSTNHLYKNFLFQDSNSIDNISESYYDPTGSTNNTSQDQYTISHERVSTDFQPAPIVIINLNNQTSNISQSNDQQCNDQVDFLEDFDYVDTNECCESSLLSDFVFQSPL